MTENNQKSKSTNSEVIYLFQCGKDLLFLSYDSGHPKRIDIDQFHIGKLRLFRKNKVYSAELKSKPFLNPSLIWNVQTFELMLKKMNQFVLEEENIDFSEWIFLCVYIKVKGQSINLLKIRLVEEFGIEPPNQLWNEFRNYNTFKAKYLSQTSRIIQTHNEQIQLVLNRLQKTQEEQMEKVTEVRKRLSALMYEKQKKIMQLTGDHRYKWIPQEANEDQRINKCQSLSVQSNRVNFMSSQDDHVLVGSLFDPSQTFLN